jgi:DNA/RNA-binding domain of Phe-tRNA-synthetase-like protein
VLNKIGATPLSDIDSLTAWRRAFSAFGVKPTQYRSAAEALLRRLTKKGDIPLLNTLVDLGNLVSIRYRLPVAIFDTRATTGPVTVRFADGDEYFTTLGADEVEQPVPGEVIFVDQVG